MCCYLQLDVIKDKNTELDGSGSCARDMKLYAVDVQLDGIEDKNKELDGLAEQSRQRADKISKLEADLQRFQQGGSVVGSNSLAKPGAGSVAGHSRYV